jgi:tetratricopeptide (TPR) repeat protein
MNVSIRISPTLQQKIFWGLRHYLVPIIMACLMIGATFLPWIIDTLGGEYSAWKVQVNIDWQIQFSEFNYGLICVLCAGVLLYRVLNHWRLRDDPRAQAEYQVVSKPVGWLCLFPIGLLMFQYLFADVEAIDILAQHEIQMLLIQQQFTYNVLNQVLTLVPFTTSPTNYGATVVSGTTLGGRFILLLDSLGPGVLLPLAAGITGLVYSGYSGAAARKLKPVVPFKQRLKEHWPVWLLAGLFLLVVFGRAPAAMASEYQAKQVLSMGDYNGAISWLNLAVVLNPGLNDLATYHNERGRADYYMQTGHLTDDAHTYLASVYESENDYTDATNELVYVWDNHRNENLPWLKEQLSFTLEWLSEFSVKTTTTVGEMGVDGLPLENNTATQQTNPSGLMQDTTIQPLLNSTPTASNGLQSASTPLSPKSSLSTQELCKVNNNSQGTTQNTATQNQNCSSSQLVVSSAQRTGTLDPVLPRQIGQFEAIPWLAMLAEVDSTNVYAQYTLGQTFYLQNGFDGCIEYMQNVLYDNPNANVQSSADTYLALSMIKQGKVAQGRQLLLQAIKLDIDFNNNTAREELSGLK